MHFFHGIIVCKKDEHLIEWHIEQVDKLLECLGATCTRFLYYGIDLDGAEPDTGGRPYWIVPFFDTYENLPLKTYGMVWHALTIPGWTHLLKTDVNSYPSVIKPEIVRTHHLAGYRTTTAAGITAHDGRVRQAGLNEPYMGPHEFPEVWCGGPAYIMSRLLAMKLGEKGAWWARSWPYEDVMVSALAVENGWPAAGGVGYWTDGNEYHN